MFDRKAYRKKYAKEYAERHRPKMNAIHRKYRNTPDGRAYVLWTSAKSRATKYGYSFNLTREWVLSKLTRGVCEVTGIAFKYVAHSVHSPSIDRIDNSKGYTEDNCRVVLHMYNAGKSVGTDEDMLELAYAILNYNKPQEATA